MSRQYKRIAVKIGSNVLARKDGALDVTRMSALVDQVAELRGNGIEVILVSSGAVASGRGELEEAVPRRMDSVERRQLFSAVGQVKLINLYYELFREYRLPVGQVLTTKESFSTRRHYLNQRDCMTVMLENGVVPIVNENDTVSVTELMFTDNDELSGLIATMMDVQALIMLTDVDGIYDGPPGEPGAEVIREVEPERDLQEYVRTGKSGFGRGGMTTKCSIARKVADEGIEVVIANGKRDDMLADLVLRPGSRVCTRFAPQEGNVSSVKKWVAHGTGFTKGKVYLDAKAVEAVYGDRAASILPVGITRVEGDFEKGDLIRIMSPEGQDIGVGRAAYGREEAARVIGRHDCKPLVHYDYLYLE